MSVATDRLLPPNDPAPGHRITLDAIIEARKLIDPVFLNTPRYICEPLGEALGCRLELKVETLNPIRSFKGRGASLLVRKLRSDQVASRQAPLVSASAGNWGQALAYACREIGQSLVLYAASNANSLKVERMRALGAEVRLAGADFDSAKSAAARYAAEFGLRMVADGSDVEASVGAATIAVEAMAGAEFDVVLVPLGNGALLTGMGRWIKAVSPSTEMIGVSALGADAMARSWQTGDLVERESVATIADGIAVRIPIAAAVKDMAGTVDDVVLVSDDEIVAAMRLLLLHTGIAVEPAGAAGIAALRAFGLRFRGKRVLSVLCGSNLTEAQMSRWLT